MPEPGEKLRRMFFRGLRNEDGAVAVEFSILLPLFVGIIFLIIEAARMVYTLSATLYAAEQATRFAAVNYDATTTEIEAIAAENMLYLNKDNLRAIVITNPAGDLSTNGGNTKIVTVTINYDYVPLLPIHKLLGKDIATKGFTLTSASKGFRSEQ